MAGSRPGFPLSAAHGRARVAPPFSSCPRRAAPVAVRPSRRSGRRCRVRVEAGGVQAQRTGQHRLEGLLFRRGLLHRLPRLAQLTLVPVQEPVGVDAARWGNQVRDGVDEPQHGRPAFTVERVAGRQGGGEGSHEGMRGGNGRRRDGGMAGDHGSNWSGAHHSLTPCTSPGYRRGRTRPPAPLLRAASSAAAILS